jgi:Ca2+-binding RTX toxin-like protein
MSGGTNPLVLTLNGSNNTTLFSNGAAQDTIRNIENAIGGSGHDTLTGDGLANQLNGGAGNDTLNGKENNDILTGGAGADTHVFDTALNAATNVDHITDFAGIDTIQLDDSTLRAVTFIRWARARGSRSAGPSVMAHHSRELELAHGSRP